MFEALYFQPEILCANACVTHAAAWVADHCTCYQCRTNERQVMKLSCMTTKKALQCIVPFLIYGVECNAFFVRPCALKADSQS